MPINFNLEELRNETNCYYYFETGLGDSKNIKRYKPQSCYQAVNSNFEKIFSIEIEKYLYDIGVEVYQKEIEKGRVVLIHDDSAKMDLYMDNNILDKKTLFFLDAHHKNSANQLPLIDELYKIKNLDYKEHIICIDDIRKLVGKKAWGVTVNSKYNNHVDHIIDVIKSINSNYKIKYLKGIIENDVLCAYL